MLKVAEEALVATATEAGAVNVGAALFDSVTMEPPKGAVWDRVMVQEAAPLELRVPGVHCKDDTRPSAIRETVVDAEESMSEAIRIAVRVVERTPVEMPKVAEDALAGTVTEAGAVKVGAALFDSVTTEPPAGAALDRVTAQEAAPLELRAFGVHCKDETLPGVCRETVVDAEDPLSEAVRVAI
jgi:hypothetical protein